MFLKLINLISQKIKKIYSYKTIEEINEFKFVLKILIVLEVYLFTHYLLINLK